MAGFDTRNALNLAIRALGKAALERNAGGWIPPREQERRQRDAMRQEQQQARQAEKQQQARQKQFISDEKDRQKNLSAFQKGNHPEVPSVVYHGSTRDFSNFSGQPNWFAEDPYVAEGYSGRKGSVYPAHLSLKRPIHIKDFDMNDDAVSAFPLAESLGIPREYLNDLGYKHAFEVINNPHFVEVAMRNGHDGIIVHEGKNKTFATFNPNQIKSATGNQGTFDPSNPDITKSEGGPILSKQFPTHYMPNVGRQVMQDGGVPDDKNQVGLYSKASRVAAALPQKKATGAQMVAALRDPKRGVKKEELINAGVMLPTGEAHPDWANRSVTADELAKHFKDQQPQIEEKVLGRTIKGQPYPEEYTKIEQSIIDKYKPELDALDRQQFNYSLPQGTRLVAQRKIEELRDKMYAEIDATLPSDREQLLEAAKDKTVPTKYQEWTLPGGENYREVLLKLPHEKKQRVGVTSTGEIFTEEELSNPIVRKTAEKIGLTMEDRMMPTMQPFLSQHWGDDPNVLAHIRMADRTGPNGEKILHVEELQSDWGQKGREEGFGVPPEEEELWQKTEGRMREIRSREAQIIADELEGKPVDKREQQQLYIERQRLTPVYSALELKRDTAVPHGPYVTSTEGWTDLALKRVLKEAAEGGYDKIVFTPGEEQAKRYNLSAHVDRLAYDPEEKTLSYWKKGANAWTDHPEYVEPNKLHKVIGKEAAKQLLATEPNKLSGIHSMDTKDLVIGEEGMKAYYNQIVPSRLQDLVKKHDPNARVGVSQIGNIVPKNTELEQFSQSINFEQPVQPKAPIQFTGASLDVTPQMRESVMKGQEAYKRGGMIKSKHPALSIAGTHIRAEMHGEPMFTGRL